MIHKSVKKIKTLNHRYNKTKRETQRLSFYLFSIALCALAYKLTSFGIGIENIMVKNTEFSIFTKYGDTTMADGTDVPSAASPIPIKLF